MTRQLRLPAFVVACLVAGALAVQCLAMIGTALADEPTVVLDAGPAIAPGNAPATAEDPKADTGPPPAMPADPIAQPAETYSVARYYWQLGGWPFTVAVLWILSVVASAKLRPADKDGDGEPDPEKGAKGYAWVTATALAMVLVPVAAVAAKADGATWLTVASTLPVAALFVWRRWPRSAKAVG